MKYCKVVYKASKRSYMCCFNGASYGQVFVNDMKFVQTCLWMTANVHAVDCGQNPCSK